MKLSEGRVEIIACWSMFLLQGFATGIWLAHIPTIYARLGLEPRSLGILLAAAYGGGFLGSAVLGASIPRIGEQTALRACLLLFLIAILPPILAQSAIAFGLALVVLGFLAGAFNTALNTWAASVERRDGRHLMAGFHGFYSVGGALGAAAGAAIVWFGAQNGVGAAFASLLLLVAGQFVIREAGSSVSVPMPVRPDDQGRHFPFALLPLAAIAFLGDSVEVYVNDWSAIFLIDQRGVDAGLAIWGFVVFSIATAIVRFSGHWALGRWGFRAVFVIGGALAAAGFLLSLLIPFAIMSTLSFALVGIGTALLIPSATTLSARQPGISASAGVSVISMSAHLGWIVTPPLIGAVSQVFGLQAGAATMALAGVFIAAWGYAYRGWSVPLAVD